MMLQCAKTVATTTRVVRREVLDAQTKCEMIVRTQPMAHSGCRQLKRPNTEMEQCESSKFPPIRKRLKLDKGGGLPVCADGTHGCVIDVIHPRENGEDHEAMVLGLARDQNIMEAFLEHDNPAALGVCHLGTVGGGRVLDQVSSYIIN